jgi:prefoldin subunit 5
MTAFFNKGKNNNKQEDKIVQLIRSWYYNNGKSIDEIITELKDGWGLGDDQIKDLLIRAGLIAPSDQYAKLPMQRKLTAAEALTFKTIAGQTSAGSRLSSAAVKQMIDNAISDLENRIEKRIRMLDKNLSDTNAVLNQYKEIVEKLQQEINDIKQLMDDRAILNVLSNVRQEINEIMDKIESLRMLLNENKERISKLESKIALLQISQLKTQQSSSSVSDNKAKNETRSKPAKSKDSVEVRPKIRKYSFEELFTPKVSTPSTASERSSDEKVTSTQEASDQSDETQFKNEIMEILKILEE